MQKKKTECQARRKELIYVCVQPIQIQTLSPPTEPHSPGPGAKLGRAERLPVPLPRRLGPGLAP